MTEKLTAKNLAALNESNTLWAKAKECLPHKERIEAESLYKQSIDKRIAAVGEDDHSVSQLLDELGALYLDMGRVEPALEQFKRAAALLEKNFYAGHFYLGSVVEHLGEGIDLAGQVVPGDEAHGRRGDEDEQREHDPRRPVARRSRRTGRRQIAGGAAVT